jgi:photosystem II stability/assembly factor-like uncharacterized protein
MKYLTLILCYSLTFFIQVSAQSTPPSGTEVVVPWALSFFTGKGASNLHFSDSLNGIAYWKHNPHYSLTSDGGKTWKDGKTTSQLDRIMLMYSIGRDSIVAVRDSQYIFHSFNAGETWTLANTLWSGEKFGYGTFFNHKHSIIFPNEGGIIVSTDLGATWISNTWAYGPIRTTPFYDKGYLFVIEQYSTTRGILYSTDNGFTWVKVSIPASLANYRTVGKSDNGFYLITNSNRVYLLSMTGEILKSFQPGATDSYPYFAYISDNEIWSIDNIGYGTRHLRKFSFADTSTVTVIMLGNHSMMFTSIIPTTWDRLLFSANGYNMADAIMTYHKSGHRDIKVEQLELPGRAEASCLFFVNGAKGFAGLANGKIIKTTDGGYSWSETTLPTITGVVQKFVQRSESEFIEICAAGLILETSDGGNSWQFIISPMQKMIKGAAFKGRDTIFFCTSDSIFMTTPAWQQITPVATGLSGGYYTNLEFYDGLNGSALYRYGNFRSKAFFTTDGGNSWVTRDFNNMMYSFDPSSVGIYYALTGGFSSWYNDTTGGRVYQDGSLMGINHKPGGLIAVMYDKGDFFYNFGNNSNFIRINLGTGIAGKFPVPADENTAYLLCANGRIFKFSHVNNSPPPSSVLRISPVNGSPYELRNTTLKWEEPWTVSPIIEYHLQLAAGDTSNIVENIAGISSTSHPVNLMADSTIYFWRVRARNIYGWSNFNSWYSFRSSVFANQPVSWQSPFTVELTTAIMLPDGRVIVGTGAGGIARTDQPPVNWTIVNSTTFYPMNRFLYDPNNNIVFALTTGNLFFYSLNRSISWARKEAPFGSTYVNSFGFAPPNVIYGAAHYGSIFKAVTTPLTWTNILFSPHTGNNLAIATLDSTRVIAVGESGSVVISTDGGSTFQYTGLNQTEIFRGASFAPDGTIVVLNQNGERRISTDMGITWDYEFFETKAPIRDLVTRNGISVIIDTMGGIYTSLTPTDPWRYSKMPDGFKPRSVEISADKVLLPSQAGKLFYMPLYNGNPTGVKDENVVTEFRLAQNYPNPFNSSTVIRFSVKNPGDYTIEVFSSIGERVTTLFNGWLETGEHRINFDSKELSNGIYLYRLRGGGVNLTKKMIILK